LCGPEHSKCKFANKTQLENKVLYLSPKDLFLLKNWEKLLQLQPQRTKQTRKDIGTDK